MDSPVRKALKRNDYLRHKLFRKIKRRQRNKMQLDLKIAEKELKRRLRRPKFDGGTDDNKVKVTERTYPDGTVVYFADDGKTLTPINMMDSDDMSNWTWQDSDNPRVTYTGIGNTKDPGEIKQGEGPKSGLGKLHKKLYQVSNRHLQDPIFGAYARFADSWDNDTNPLKAIWEQPATKAAVMEFAWAKGLQAANRFKNVAVNYERLGKMAPKELEEFFMSRPDLVRESNRAKLFEAAYNKFVDDVVKPKYKQAIAATGREYTPEMDAAISNTPKIYEADFGPYSKWGGYYSTGGGRIMMNSRAAGTDSLLFGRHAHEVHHGYRDLLGLLLKFHPNLDIQTNGESMAQIARSGYTPGEMNALEAYQFTPLKLLLNPDLRPLWEKGASNAEIASRIYYDTRLTGKELNDAIMKMPKSKFVEYVGTNAYGQNFLKSPLTKETEKAMRKAVATVASVMPFGVAYNLKYDGGKDEPLKYVANVSDLDVHWNPETGYMEYNGKEYPVGMDEVVVTAPRKKFSWANYYSPIWSNPNSKYSTLGKPINLRNLAYYIATNSAGNGSSFLALMNSIFSPSSYYGFIDFTNLDFSTLPKSGQNIPALALYGDSTGFTKYKGPKIIMPNGTRFDDKNTYDALFLDKDTLHFPMRVRETIKKYSDPKSNSFSLNQIGLAEREAYSSNKPHYDANRYTMLMHPNEMVFVDTHDTGNVLYDALIKNKPKFTLRVPIKYGDYNNDDLDLIFGQLPTDMFNPDHAAMFHPNFREIDLYNDIFGSKYNSGKDIHIKPSKRGTFTAAAKKHGMSVQAYARKVLKAPKGKYSSAMRKKANFARNASRWNK